MRQGVLTRDINWMGKTREKKGNGHEVVQLNSTKNIREEQATMHRKELGDQFCNFLV